MEDKIFNLSLAVSALMHAFLFISLLFSNAFVQKDLKQRDIQIVYPSAIKDVRVAQQKPVMPKSIQEEKWAPTPKVLAKRLEGGTALGDLAKQPAKMDLQKMKPAALGAFTEKREISVPVLKSEKITNPKYLDYNDRLRAKIQARAYSYIDDPAFQNGDVYLTFVLQSDGQLKQIKIIDSKTHANEYLRSVGLRSIKESNPFPAFPKDLSYPELSFNVVISFEVKK